jgi:lipoprotein-anchoring transpeptidase ErfK/SrfK
MISSQRHLMTSVAATLRWGVALGALGCISACGPDASQKSATNAPVAQSNAAVNSASLAATVNPTQPVVTPDRSGNVTIDSNAAASFAAGASDASLPPAAKAIDMAVFQAAPAKASARLAYDPVLLKAEVLLDRAGFSPGVIDGRGGTNLQHALEAFDVAHGLASDGSLDAGTWNALTAADAAPAVQSYVITADDEAGPFIGTPPTDYQALSKLPALGYRTPLQELSEKFHMDQKLLQALNPGADFGKVGQALLVAAPRPGPRDMQVTRIEVDKSDDEVRAFGADGKLLAFYPATVGSAERPAPSGVFAVVAVAPHPAYFYDPARLTFTPAGAKGKLRIAPGPNNPVGSTWIALTVPTYGIHGSPDPTTIGKRQSHGCVRLTNWDAVELGKSVKKGVQVAFVGQDKTPGAKA